MEIQIDHLPIPPPGGKRRRKGRCIAVLSPLALAAVVLCMVTMRQPDQYDPRAAVKPEKSNTMTVSKEKLQRMEEESRFAFQINTRPEFESGESPGTLFLENSMTNSQDMKVTLELQEDGKRVYESPVLHPGEQLLEDRLGELLAGGIYPAIARILIVDPETGKETGENAVAVTLVIKGEIPG